MRPLNTTASLIRPLFAAPNFLAGLVGRLIQHRMNRISSNVGEALRRVAEAHRNGCIDAEPGYSRDCQILAAVRGEPVVPHKFRAFDPSDILTDFPTIPCGQPSPAAPFVVVLDCVQVATIDGEIDLMVPLPETPQEAPAKRKRKRAKVKKAPKTVRGAARETKSSRTKKGKG